MKNLFAFLLINLFTILINIGLHAQANSAAYPPSYHGDQISPREMAERSERTSELKGNPFLFADKDKKGIIYSKGNSFEGDSLNYNIYQNQIVTFKEEDSVFVYDSQLIDSVKIDDKRLHKMDGQFFEVIETGPKVSLFKKYKTRIAEGQVNVTDRSKGSSRLVIMDDYYVLSQDQLMKFKPSKANLEDVFGDQSQEMKKRMKSEKLEYKKEKDLMRIFEIYNSL